MTFFVWSFFIFKNPCHFKLDISVIQSVNSLPFLVIFMKISCGKCKKRKCVVFLAKESS